MPSPFPGMDPYLEDPAFWPDFHGTLVTAARAALTPVLPAGFYAELDRCVWLEQEDPVRRERRGRPDVHVTNGGGHKPRSKAGSPVGVAKPTVWVRLATLEKVEGPRYSGATYSETAVWAFTVRDPFPVIPVPLTTDHGSISLDLKPCADRAYDDANYGPQVDYTQPPVPAFRPSDAEWAAELLKKSAKRKAKK